MKALALTAALALAVPLHAQFLAPELEPLAARYKAERVTFEKEKDKAIAQAQQPYLSALDAAGRTATSAGSLAVVAAIRKESEALKNPTTMPPTLPEGLPKTLQATRKSCLNSIARIDANLASRQKAIDADYFRALSLLQPKAVGNPGLAQQIDEEKEKLLASAQGSDLGRQMEVLLLRKEWIHRGQYHYKFRKGGWVHIKEMNLEGRFEVHQSGFASLVWKNNQYPGQRILFNTATNKLEHSAGGEFVPVDK